MENENDTETKLSDAQQRKIAEIKNAAILKMQVKKTFEISQPSSGWRRLKSYNDTCLAARALNRMPMQENASRKQENAATQRRQRSISMIQEPTALLSKPSRKISCQEKLPKLPEINMNGRARSSTVGGTPILGAAGRHHFRDGAKSNSGLYKQEENNSIERGHKETNGILSDSKHSEKDLSLVFDNEEMTSPEKGSKGLELGPRSPSSISISPRGSSMPASPRKVSTSKSPRMSKNSPVTNIQIETNDSKLDFNTISEESFPNIGIPSIESKVKSFINNAQPKAPPQSLKLSKDFTEHRDIHRRRGGKDNPPRLGDMDLINQISSSNLCLNPFIKSDGANWHYTDTYGKCRYLRVPLTPVLTVDEIFKKEEEDCESQTPIQ